MKIDLRPSELTYGGDPEASEGDQHKWRLNLAVEILRSGEPITEAVRHAIADLIERKPRQRGRPGRPPRRWYEIGQSVDVDGLSVKEAAKLWGVEPRTAERGLAYYRKAIEADEEAKRDFPED